MPLLQNLQVSPTSAKGESLLVTQIPTDIRVFNSHSFPGYSEISRLWNTLLPSIDGVWRSPVLPCTYSSSAVFQTFIGTLLADLMLSKLRHLNKEKCNIPKQGINQIFHLGSLLKNNNELENYEVVWMFFLFWSHVLEGILTWRSYSTLFVFLTLKGCDCSLRKIQVYAAIPNFSQGGGSFISIFFLLFSFLLYTHRKTSRVHRELSCIFCLLPPG